MVEIMERIGVIRDNGVVVNVILWADHTPDQLLADGVTDFQEVTDLNPIPGMYWTWDETHGYRRPSPFPSWSWDGVDWQPPTPQPEGYYLWNEDAQTWDAIPTEEPAP
jgi:hypothetical protein